MKQLTKCTPTKNNTWASLRFIDRSRMINWMKIGYIKHQVHIIGEGIYSFFGEESYYTIKNDEEF